MDRNILSKSAMAPSLVALRKESVDRNNLPLQVRRPDIPSLSARRAWIEIMCQALDHLVFVVALRKESVDRNIGVGTTRDRRGGRSPQGERG